MNNTIGTYNFWYDSDKESVTNDVFNTIQSLKGQYDTRTYDMRRFAALYRNKSAVGFDPGEFVQGFSDTILVDRVAYNVVSMCVDTCVAKLTMQKPVPRFLTSAGDWELQEKAKLMERLCLGVMKQSDIYKIAGEALRDAAIYGIGFVRVQKMGDKIICRRIHPSRIIIDDQACLDGPSTVLFYQADVAEEELLANFPGEEDMLENARKKYTGTGAQSHQLITYSEAWHEAIGDRPGRYVCCVDSPTESKETGGPGLLFDEEWTGPIPIIPIRWSSEVAGYWGIGIAERLEGIQLEIIDTLRKIQLSHQLHTTPYLLLPISAGIDEKFLSDNQDGKIIKYSGNMKPEVITPPAINPQVYEHLEKLYNRAFETVGISQLSAMAQKPAGLNSGIALRTYLDVESTKFAPISKEWEDLFVQIAKLIVFEASRMPAFKINAVHNGRLEKISLADAKLAENEYDINVWPASSLPLTPAGRLDRVVEMLGAQLISQEEAKELLDFPDLERFNRLENAQYEDFQRIFEYMLKEGEYIEPLPWQNLQQGIKICVSYWTRARMDGADEDRLDLLVRWMTEVDEMISAAMEPPPPAPTAMQDLKAAQAETEIQGGQVPNQQGAGLPGQAGIQLPQQQLPIK